MPAFCCVSKCGSRGQKDKTRFYRIPAIRNFAHKKHINELSKMRRERWLLAIGRQDLDESKLKNATICSKHFLTGRPADLKDEMDPDWIPSVNMTRICSLHFKKEYYAKTPEYLSIAGFSLKRKLTADAIPTEFGHNEHNYCKTSISNREQSEQNTNPRLTSNGGLTKFSPKKKRHEDKDISPEVIRQTVLNNKKECLKDEKTIVFAEAWPTIKHEKPRHVDTEVIDETLSKIRDECQEELNTEMTTDAFTKLKNENNQLKKENNELKTEIARLKAALKKTERNKSEKSETVYELRC